MADPFDILLGTSSGAVTPGERATVSAESGGNPAAVSPKGAVGAWQVMPNTQKNPGFGVMPAKDDSQDELNRVGKDYYNAMVNRYNDPTLGSIAYNFGPGNTDKWLQAGGDFNKLPQETRDYVGKVATLTALNKQSAPQSSDPFDVLLNYTPGKGASVTPPAPTPSVPTDDGYGNIQFHPLTPEEANRKAAGLGTSAADFALGIIPAAIGTGAYWLNRAIGKTPEQAQETAAAYAQPTENPVGKITGMVQTPEYQQALPTQVQQFIGEHIEKNANWIASQLGMNPADVQNAINAGMFVLPSVAKLTPIKSVTERLGGAPEEGISKAPVNEPALAGVGAAESNYNPFPPMANEETVRGGYPRLKQAKIGADVTPDEQTNRAAIASEILGPDGLVRDGVKTGNIQTLYNEDIQARSPNPTPTGVLLKQAISNEQQALPQYAEGILNQIGAKPQFESPYAFGQFINSVMHGDETEPGIRTSLEAAKRDVYQKAFEAAGNQPIEFSRLQNLMQDPTIQATLKAKNETNFLGGLQDLINLAQNTGFDRAPAGSVAAAEMLRQNLNDIWTPGNSKFVQRFKNAIDEDIAAAGGPGLLQRARALHGAEQSIFEDAPGMSKLFGEVNPNTGISEGMDFEKIGKNLNNIGFDDWRHIVDTLKKVANEDNPQFNGQVVNFSDDVRQAAQQAINEVGGELMRDVIQAGGKNKDSWNGAAANARMTALKDKLQYVLPPDLIRKTHVLNYGGQIMPSSVSYEGAALQALRAQKQGLFVGMLPKAGGALGGAIGTYFGSPVVGGLAGLKTGEAAQSKMIARSQAKEARKLLNKMQENAQSGQNKLSELEK